jgi:hypothetical protein
VSNLERFRRLFRGRESCYGQYLVVEDGKKAWTVSEPVGETQWEGHLEGEGPFLGMVPITLDNLCYFAAIDIDDEGVDLEDLAEQVLELQLPLIVCRSKSGGAHLYLFLKDPAPAKLVVEKMTEWSSALGRTANADGRATEIFPKQTRLKEAETGNWINLPYYGSDETNRYAVHNGQHLSLEGFLGLAEQTRISSARLSAIQVVSTNPFSEGPPCLQTLHQIGIPAGGRNQGLYNIGCFFKLAFPEEWEDLIRDYNKNSGKIDPPINDKDLSDLIKSLGKREYIYKCSELPIGPHCKRAECKKRKFGIKGFASKKAHDNFPEMKNLVKVMTDPPQWQLDVNDQTIDLVTDDLMSLLKFRKTCLEKLTIIVPMIKTNEWDEKVRELLQEHTVQEAPEDAGILGQFRSLVSEFLVMRDKADSKEDLLRGIPYEDKDKGIVLFRSGDLLSFLERRKFRDYTMAKIYTALRGIGAGHIQLNVNGACVQAWHLPVPKGEQNEEFTKPVEADPEF